jgi:hypothetical protein
MRTLADLVIFVAYCDDEVLDPDVAVSTLEGVATSLKALSAADLAAFSTFLEAEANRLKDAEGEQAERYRLLLEHLGLRETPRRKTSKRRR